MHIRWIGLLRYCNGFGRCSYLISPLAVVIVLRRWWQGDIAGHQGRGQNVLVASVIARACSGGLWAVPPSRGIYWSHVLGLDRSRLGGLSLKPPPLLPSSPCRWRSSNSCSSQCVRSVRHSTCHKIYIRIIHNVPHSWQPDQRWVTGERIKVKHKL